MKKIIKFLFCGILCGPVMADSQGCLSKEVQLTFEKEKKIRGKRYMITSSQITQTTRLFGCVKLLSWLQWINIIEIFNKKCFSKLKVDKNAISKHISFSCFFYKQVMTFD